MDINAFTFLHTEFPEIYKRCKEMEENLVKNLFEESGNYGRKALEALLDKIFKIEKISRKEIYVIDENPSNILNMQINHLYKKKLLPVDIKNDCHRIRKLGNSASHHNNIFSGDDAKNMHELLYNVTSYFYKKYSMEMFPETIPIYSGVKYKEESIEDKIKRILMEEKEKNFTSDEEEISWIKNYEFTKVQDSYLLGELKKLKESSQEAVESSNSLSEFKLYLHVNRSIQDELLNKLYEVSELNSSKLIMLCGSVGDGKSHLLAYLNQNYPELMKNFKTWNDATESDDPNKTCIDTLSTLLTNFNDENIDSSNEKLILLINLGVLNNFIDSKYAKENYSRLSSSIKELNVFDSNDFSMNFDKDYVSIISFSDYHLFEFDEKHPYKLYSKYLSNLFNKITCDDDENPFYQAYLKDINNNIISPVIYNYKLFTLDDVQDIIITNLIKVMIKYKKIISTRELLNFIYEILVPADIPTFNENSSIISYMDKLLPDLLFNSTNRCNILEILHLEDPIIKRNEITDELLLKLNVSNNIKETLSNYMNVEQISFIMDSFGDDYNLRDLKDESKLIIVSSIIRFLNIFGNNTIKELFTKKSYIDYVNYLYHYNYGNNSELRVLYRDIESAIYNWKGRLDNKKLCIEQINDFKIAKQFNLKPIIKDHYIINDQFKNRFKTEINLSFTVDNNDKNINLKLDYPLYEIITKLNKGYKPNKKEQKDLLLFNDFIDELINLNNSNQFLIHNTKNDISFDLELDSFGKYTFRRV